MGPKLFKVPSKFILIYWICWFDKVRNMWGLLATSYAPTIANDNLANKAYFCLGLFYNLVYLLRPVDSRSTVLGIFYPFYPLSTSRYGVPMGALDDCSEKQTFFKFDVFRTPLEVEHLGTSEADFPSLAGLSCKCGSG